MEQKQPLVSINLLTYNGEKYISECFKSILNQSYPNLEILIIDNGSTDKTVDYLKKLPQKVNLKTIFNKKNVGFSAGHNQGIKESGGEYILCLNQDIVLDPNFVQKTIELFKKDKKIGAVQGKLFRWQIGMPASQEAGDYHVSRIIDTTGFVFLKNRRIINREQGQLDEGQVEKIEEIFGADGAAPVYRRKVLEDVKITLPARQRTGAQNHNQIKNLNDFGEYFDEDFFAYKEDVDLAWRMRLRGWKTFYQPKAVAWHDRTAGDNATRNYFIVIKERLKISKFGKYLAFKNGRLMQIKNEQFGILVKHLPWFLPKEIAAWGYVLLFERYTWKAIKDLIRQMPLAFKKRKVIMANKKVSSQEMTKWFK